MTQPLPDERPKATGLAWPGLPALLGVVLAIGMTWPLVLHLGSSVNTDLGDPLGSTWQVAWIGHALVHEPLHLYQANNFWPEHNSLAFTDVLIGYAPAGVVAEQGLHAALVVHNLLFLFAYALAFLGAYLLGRELGAGKLGGIAAGAAFAYAPWRLAQSGHLQVISSGGIPLALFLLVRGYRRHSGRIIFAGGLVATWQITLGFSLGLQFAYLLLVLAAIAVALWLRRGRPPVGRAVRGATAMGVCVFAVVTALLAQPLLRVVHDHPEAKRYIGQVAFFSPPPHSFLAAPAGNFLWAGPTADERDSLRSSVEQTLFPGVSVLVLALLGLASAAYRASLRLWLAVGVVVCAVLSLGLPYSSDPAHNYTKGNTPYRLLFELAPGWDGIRTPGRLNTLTSLGLALLAGAGLCLVLRRVGHLFGRGGPRARHGAASVAAAALVGVVLLEGFGSLPHPRVPPVPSGQIAAPAPQLHLPSDDFHDDGVYSYWSIGGFQPIVNGAASFSLLDLQSIRQVATTFPDAGSVSYLRQLGVRTVILHTDLAFGTPWQDATERPTAGLPLTRENSGNVVFYHLEPESPTG